MKAPRPIPSELADIGDKLDSFDSLLKLKNSVYRVIADRLLLCDEKNEKIGGGGSCGFFRFAFDLANYARRYRARI